MRESGRDYLFKWAETNSDPRRRLRQNFYRLRNSGIWLTLLKLGVEPFSDYLLLWYRETLSLYRSK